jgi:hypothetical protein
MLPLMILANAAQPTDIFFHRQIFSLQKYFKVTNISRAPLV